MNTPLVSICCLAYNHEPYIRECLEGFMMQQCDFDFEVLIHDDASTDGTVDIIREYEAKFPGIIKPIYQIENQYSKGLGSISVRFNFPRAQGKYIALCEGDDYWTDPLKLQRQVDFLEENEEYIMSTENGLIIDELRKKEQNFNTSKTNLVISAADLLDKRKFPTASVLFRKVQIDIPYGGDTVLWLWLSAKGKIHFKNINSSVYRRGVQGVTENTNKRIWAEEMQKWNSSMLSIITSNNMHGVDPLIFKRRNQTSFFTAFVEEYMERRYLSSLKMLYKAFYYLPMRTLLDLKNKLA